MARSRPGRNLGRGERHVVLLAPPALMRALTVLGDAALLVPASALLLAFLWRRSGRQAALVWLAALVASTGLILALKLAFNACGAAFLSADAVSPSGHAGFAATFYAALALLLGAGREPSIRILYGVAAALLIAVIALSRVAIGVHSATEVGIGLAVGVGGACLFAFLWGQAGRPGLPIGTAARGLAILAGAALLLAVVGGHLSLEPTIARVADRLATLVDACVETPRPRRTLRPF